MAPEPQRRAQDDAGVDAETIAHFERLGAQVQWTPDALDELARIVDSVPQQQTSKDEPGAA